MYLLDRENLGGAQTGTDAAALSSMPVLSQSTFGSAAYYNGAIYIGPQNSPLFAFPVANAALAFSPFAQSKSSLGVLGATPSISADGHQNGIVWTISAAGGGSLLAYNAANLSELYNSNSHPMDNLGGFTEFVGPTIADSRVFAGAGNNISI